MHRFLVSMLLMKCGAEYTTHTKMLQLGIQGNRATIHLHYRVHPRQNYNYPEEVLKS